MPIYYSPPPHEQLSVFFGEFFRKMRKADPSTYGAFLLRAEEEFKRTGYREKISSGVKNILLVRLDAIGDMVLNSAFLREVRANFPKARITLVVSPLVYPMVELCPYVNEVLIFDMKMLARNLPFMLEKIADFCREHFWQRKFSHSFYSQCGGDNLPGLFMTWLSGANERIGYCISPYRNFFDDTPEKTGTVDELLLNHIVKPHKTMTFQVEKYLYILSEVGLKVNETHTELFYGEADSQRAQEFLADIPSTCKKILFGIGAGAPNRKYPVDKYLVALKEIAKKDFVFVIVGGKAELEDAEYFENNLPRGKVLNLVGKTTLRETEAIVSQTDFYLGNVTGVMHMAAAAQIPVLTIYREAKDMDNIFPMKLSEFLNFPPWQTKAIILRPEHRLDDCATLPPIYGGCRHKEAHCITQITPQQIIDGFEKLTTS